MSSGMMGSGIVDAEFELIRKEEFSRRGAKVRSFVVLEGYAVISCLLSVACHQSSVVRCLSCVVCHPVVKRRLSSNPTWWPHKGYDAHLPLLFTISEGRVDWLPNNRKDREGVHDYA